MPSGQKPTFIFTTFLLSNSHQSAMGRLCYLNGPNRGDPHEEHKNPDLVKTKESIALRCVCRLQGKWASKKEMGGNGSGQKEIASNRESSSGMGSLLLQRWYQSWQVSYQQRVSNIKFIT